MYINPIEADTGLWLRPLEYKRKAGMPWKTTHQHISKYRNLNLSKKAP